MVMARIMPPSIAELDARAAVSPRLDDPGKFLVAPLPQDFRNGMIAVSVLASISVLTTFSLLCFITYRLIFWKKYHKQYLGQNQYIVLIYNLLWADIVQSIGFLLCAHWAVKNEIRGRTAACFIQGFTLQIGDPASGLFIMAIALHTFALVITGRKLPHKWFVTGIVALWTFLLLLVIVPLGMHGPDLFIPAGAWCWFDEKYEAERLFAHYIWIFVAEFGTFLLYTVLFFYLRHRIAESAVLGSQHVESMRRLKRVVGSMMIYPIAYLVLSLPLAAGRMSSARGNTPSVTYFCISGAMMTSSGFVDVILYTMTRRNLLKDMERSSRDRSYQRDDYLSGHIATITAASHRESRRKKPLRGTSKRRDEEYGDGEGSTDNIVQKDVELSQMGKVYQETTIEVTHQTVDWEDEANRRQGRTPR